MQLFLLSLEISCFEPNSKFVYTTLQKYGTLTLKPLVFTNNTIYQLCSTLQGKTFTIKLTISSGLTLSSTTQSYTVNSSYAIQLTCDGDAATQATCQAETQASTEAIYALEFVDIDTQVSQTVNSYNVNEYNHLQCLTTPQIAFSSAYSGFTFSGQDAQCDMSKALYKQANPPTDSVTMTVSIYDAISNNTYSVTTNAVQQFINVGANGLYTVVFDCGTLGQTCLNVYNALVNNVNYQVYSVFNFTTVLRTCDQKPYYILQQLQITNIVSTNYPNCYLQLGGQTSPQKMIMTTVPDPAQAALCIPDPRTKKTQIRMGLIGVTGKYMFQQDIASFDFQKTFYEFKCEDDLISVSACLEAMAFLTLDVTVSAMFQVGFLDETGEIVYTNFQSPVYLWPPCYYQDTAVMSTGKFCVNQTKMKDLSSCNQIISRRMALRVTLYNLTQYPVVDLKQYSSAGVDNTSLCFNCPQCTASFLSQIQNDWSAKKLQGIVQTDQLWMPLDNVKVIQIVDSTTYPIVICFGALTITVAIVVILIITE